MVAEVGVIAPGSGEKNPKYWSVDRRLWSSAGAVDAVSSRNEWGLVILKRAPISEGHGALLFRQLKKNTGRSPVVQRPIIQRHVEAVIKSHWPIVEGR